MKTVHAAPPKDMKTHNIHKLCSVATANTTPPTTIVAADTTASTETVFRARWSTIAPITAAIPKKPKSKPYPTELLLNSLTTAGSRAQSRSRSEPRQESVLLLKLIQGKSLSRQEPR